MSRYQPDQAAVYRAFKTILGDILEVTQQQVPEPPVDGVDPDVPYHHQHEPEENRPPSEMATPAIFTGTNDFAQIAAGGDPLADYAPVAEEFDSDAYQQNMNHQGYTSIAAIKNSNPQRYASITEINGSSPSPNNSEGWVAVAPSCSFKKVRYLGALLLGGGSGIVFWITSGEAGDRYANYVGASWVTFLASMGGGVTNALFNTESYLTLADVCNAVLEAEKTLTGNSSQKAEWIISAANSLFAILPVYYLGMKTDSKTDQFLTTISSLLNLPVQMDGGKSLIDWLKTYDLYDRVTRRKPKEIALRKARKLIADQLEQAAGDKNVSQFMLPLKENAPELALFKSLLNDSDKEKDNEVISMTDCCLLPAAFWALAACGIYSNLGFIVDSYNGGFSFWSNVPWSVFCAIAHALPGFGFNFKGLQKTHAFMLSSKQSLARREEPNLYWLLFSVVVFFGVFSGFTGDQMGYDAWAQCFSDNETLKVLSGVISNIGTAVTYNLPQCVFLVERCVEAYMMRRKAGRVINDKLSPEDLQKEEHEKSGEDEAVFIQKVSYLASVIRKMPLETCEKLFTHVEIRDILKDFFDKHDSKISEEVGLLKLSDKPPLVRGSGNPFDEEYTEVSLLS